MMKTKHINNLEQLREAKRKLKLEMTIKDKEVENNCIYSFINKIFRAIKNDRSALDTPTLRNLKFLASQNGKKSKFETIMKNAVYIFIGIAAPIIAQKTIGLMKEKY